MATKTQTKSKPAAKAAKPAAKAAPKPVRTKAKQAGGPLSKVKELYGSKDKLVDKVASVLADGDNDAGSLKDRLTAASNAQLLRLAKVAEDVKKAYGSRAKLIETITRTLGRAKDNDYVQKLGSFSLPKLLDLARGAERKAKQAAAAAKK